MSVQYSYTDASRRLLGDAIVCWSSGTPETAAHLAGMSAECALKSILIGLQIASVEPDGQLPRNPRRLRVHIDKLWGEFQAQVRGRQGALYMNMMPPTSPFSGWLVDHRYAALNQIAADDLRDWVWAGIAVSRILDEAVNRMEAQ